MFQGACQLMNLTWTQFGLSMKIFASSKQMKLEQDLTCLKVFIRATDLWMSGTMLYQAQVCLAKYPQ